jgi:hypothetical protein
MTITVYQIRAASGGAEAEISMEIRSGEQTQTIKGAVSAAMLSDLGFGSRMGTVFEIDRATCDAVLRCMKLNAAIINQPMNLQEFNAVNRTYGSRVNSEFAKLEKTMRQLKSSNFHKSKALAYALVYGMSHPYYNGRRLDGEPILNAYYGDMDNAEYKRAAEAANRQRAMRSSVPRPIMKQYQEAFDADSGRSSSEFTFHP